MIKNSAILKVSKNNILKNYKYFKKVNKQSTVAATIKANGYGLGDKEIFKLLLDNGCKNFFVATLDEGIKLNNRNKFINVYVLNGIQDNNPILFSKNNLIPIINSKYEMKKIKNLNLKFGIHIDTGINRLGLSFDNISEIDFKIKNICCIISHLASADEKSNNYNNIQKNRFKNLIKNFKNKDVKFSLANSNGSTLSKDFSFNMIRPGIGLYGGNNKNKILKKYLKPVVTLSGKIIQIKSIKKNRYIGYNQTYKTKKEIKIAVIGIGYADGIPRFLSNSGIVYYKENKFRIIGKISMDSLTIDITKSKYNLRVGNFIDIINFKYGIEDFAKQCNTISNEVITSIGSRVKRLYV